MKVVVMTPTSGRWLELASTIASARRNADFGDAEVDWLLVDDSDNVGKPPPMPGKIIRSKAHNFAGAIQVGWDHLRPRDDIDLIFHLEDDFIFERRIDMLALAAARPDGAAQIALKRQPVNRAEADAGGMMALHRSGITEAAGLMIHKLNFTTNPSLYPHELITTHRWPDPPGSERVFSDTLIGEGYHFAMLGLIDDPPDVRHIGYYRMGTVL